MEDEWHQIYADIEDILFPQLKVDPWERVLYYHLLRHTRLKRLTSGVFAIGALSKTLPMSDFKIREVVRSLDAKSCLKIEDRSRNGHLIHVLLPAEITGLCRLTPETPSIDVASLDFFSSRSYVAALLARENGACFYCLRALTAETCELDHLMPQVEKLDNSFRNIVASCHNCNKAKGSLQAADFIRMRYRANLLSEDELQNPAGWQDRTRSPSRVYKCALRDFVILVGPMSSVGPGTSLSLSRAVKRRMNEMCRRRLGS